MTRTIRAGLLAVVLAVVLAGVVAAPAAGAEGVTARFAPTSDWGSGHETAVTVTNGGTTALDGWVLEIQLPPGTTISSSWDADVTRSGDRYRVTGKSWAGALAPGASRSWGYVGTGPFRAPVSCTLNGADCTTGAPGPAPTPTPTPTPTPPPPPPPPVGSDGRKVVGYFTEWGIYGRDYLVQDIERSGSADRLTHIVYAFGNTTGGRCTMGDSYAATDRAFTAADSVDGVADTWDQPLRGNFHQLRELKAKHPGLRVVWSFGGWTWSGGFTEAAKDPAAFARSCRALVEDPRWADVFDGIDVDWEYPNACGLSCDTSGPQAFSRITGALRAEFGPSALVSAAITADGTPGGKISATDYAAGARNLDWLMPMTYDYFGAWAAGGPTAPHAPLDSYPGIPTAGFHGSLAIDALLAQGVPAEKMLLGIPFYGRGWQGVTQSAPGGGATGPAPGRYEPGIQDYEVLKAECPATGTVAGTAYAHCGTQWWSYDTPATIAGKLAWARSRGLGGAFFWELSGDTPDGELIRAVAAGA
jgi:chitinase